MNVGCDKDNEPISEILNQSKRQLESNWCRAFFGVTWFELIRLQLLKGPEIPTHIKGGRLPN